MSRSESIATPWGASVFGSASVDAAPDLALIRVAVKQTRPTPGESFEAVRGAVNRVRDTLRGHSIPDTAVAASQLDLRSAWHFANGERTFIGYVCTASFGIELRDLDRLETVLVDVVAAGADEVQGVTFDVMHKKELRAKARTAAVAAAKGKAELYAQAAGVRLGPVVHIEDTDSEQLQNVRRSHGAAYADPESTAEGQLTPGRITVSAGVLLGFSLLSE